MRPESPAELLHQGHIPALLITDLTNIRYITGVELSAGMLLVTRGEYALFVDGRYSEVAEANARTGVSVLPLHSLEAALNRIRRIGFEAEGVTVSRLARWKSKFKNTKFVQTSGIVQHFRRTKDAAELRAFRKAQRLTGTLMRYGRSLLKPGITERGLAWKLKMKAFDLGTDGLAFESIVAFGSHTSRPHHLPSDRKLKRGDLVQLDLGLRVDGYCADQSAVFFTGEKSLEQVRVLRAVKEAKESAAAAVRPGVTTHDLDRIARAVLKRHGYEQFFTHSLGHGVGLEIHEGVTLSQRGPRVKLLAGEIITIEPGVYLPGQFGIRLEDEYVVGH